MYYKAEDLWNKDSPYLEHKFGFKYIMKIPVGKTFRYFYNQAEIAAYKAKKHVNKTVSNARKSFGDSVNHYMQMRKVWKPLHKYTKKGEKVYFDVLSKSNANPNLKYENGVDEKGHKYIAKLTEGGKTRYFYSQEEYEAYKNRQFYQNSKNEPEFLKDFKETNTPMTSEEDLVSVNPNIVEKNDFSKNPDYTTNCTECTMVYEMRRRGYDVEYNTKYNISASDDSYDSLIYNTSYRFSYCFEKPTSYAFNNVPNEKSFKKFMKTTYPPNSRGDLTVSWKDGTGGHSMVWETDSKGRVTIKDAQMSGTGAPTVYKPEQVFKRSMHVTVTRLDNLKPKKNITKVIQDKKTPNNKAMHGYEINMNSSGVTKRQYSKSEIDVKFSNTK